MSHKIYVADLRQSVRKHSFSLCGKKKPPSKDYSEVYPLLKGTMKNNDIEVNNGQDSIETKSQDSKSDNTETWESRCCWKSPHQILFLGGAKCYAHHVEAPKN